MIQSFFGLMMCLCFLSLLSTKADAAPFVMQCSEDETISRIVIRTESASHFLGMECQKSNGAKRIFKVGRETGERHELSISSPIQKVSISRGRCGANSSRVCSIAFEYANGGRSGAFGQVTNSRQTLDKNGEVYGFYGDADSDINTLDILTRKLSGQSDPNYRIRRALRAIRDGMTGTMGFAAVIHDNHGSRKGLVRAGWAIHPLDRNFGGSAGQFDVRTKFSVGSTAKVWASAAAALHVDESIPGDVLGAQLSRFLPARWAMNLNSRFQDVTVLDVIKHQAGFRRGGPDTQVSGGELPARYRLRRGDVWPGAPTGLCSNSVGGVAGNTANRLPAGSGPPYSNCYSNSAGGMFHFILPYMANDAGIRQLENRLKNSSDADYDRQIAAAAGRFYYDYVQTHILRPAGVEANCTLRDFMPRHQVAVSYESASDRTGWMTPDLEPACAAGGWSISVSDLATLLNALAGKKEILKPLTRARMFTTGPKRVWHITNNDAHIHNGGIGDYRTEMVRFTDGYVVVLAYNSPVAVGNVTQMLLDAMRKNRR